MTLWGVDMGGTKLEGVILERPDTDAISCRLRIDTQAERGYEHILSRISLLVRKMTEASGENPAVIGFGTPGTLDPASGTMKNCNTTCLNGMPLGSDLERELGCEIRLANDANCFALAEARFGAARGARSVFGVILGTGVGGGVVIDGKPLNGLQGIAGEWGHNVLDPLGEPCYCGKRGCVETVISGPALERHYTTLSGESTVLEQIAERAAAGEAHARATIERLRDSFGAAIATVVNVLDPEMVVLGGGVSNVEALYDGIRDKMAPHVFNTTVETPVVKNLLGDSAGVFGAALLAA